MKIVRILMIKLIIFYWFKLLRQMII
jgi:hypothetical protein